MTGDEDARVAAIRQRTRAGITHPDRVLFPAAGLTKLDVVEYYLRAALFLLPYLRGRPLTMHRFPGDVGESGFFAKDAPAGTPEFVETFTHWAEAPGRDVDFVLCNNLDTLVWLANLASLEIHATLSRAASYDSPDLLFVDIDPEPPFDFDEVIEIARVVRDHLEARGLRPFVKTSGKKGLHVVVPLAAGHSFSALREFAHGIGKAVARDTPHVVSEFTRSRRRGRSSSTTSRTLPAKRWSPPTASGPRRAPRSLRPAPVGGPPARGPARGLHVQEHTFDKGGPVEGPLRRPPDNRQKRHRPGASRSVCRRTATRMSRKRKLPEQLGRRA